jgi:hypothetical protein
VNEPRWFIPGMTATPVHAEPGHIPPRPGPTCLPLEQVEHLDRQVRALEERMRRVFQPTPLIQWLMTPPGVGFILAVVIALELGDVRRFPD